MSHVDPAKSLDAPFYSSEFGEFLPAKAARLQEVLRDYNPYLQLVFIPSSQRDDTDTHPFAIQDTSPWRPASIVKHLTEREIEDTAAILQWLFEGDLSKHGFSDIMAREKAKEFASQLVREKRNADLAEERQELVAALATGGRDKKHSFRHNGKVFTDLGVRHGSAPIY